MGLILLCIFAILCWIQTCASTCSWNQILVSGTCTNCTSLFPACNTCDSAGCTSCDEGLYVVVDKRLCVESCGLVIIPETDPDQSRYFADTFNRKCYRCGPDCAKCLNNVGCVNLAKDQSASDAKASITALNSTGFQVSTACSSTLSNCTRCSSNTTCTLCSFSQLLNGSCGTTCLDTNCKFCNQNSSCCTTCSDGYVLQGCQCVSLGCAANNCKNCASASSTSCTNCNNGYFVDTSGACSLCPANCTSCSGSGTCDICNSGYILSSTGDSCVQSCSTGEYVSISSLSSYINGLTEKRTCKTCTVTCTNCLSSNLNQECLQCLKETCTNKVPTSDNNTIFIYLSNLQSDIDAKNNGTLNKSSNVFVDFMSAWSRALELASIYSSKNDGSILKIQILLLKGVHYILNINTFDKTAIIDSKNTAFEIKISPNYCSLSSSMNSSAVCTLDTEKVTIFNKIGYKLHLKVPQKLTIENVVFDMVEGIIPYANDVSSVLTKRANFCQYNNSTRKMVNLTSTETCSLRSTLTDSCAKSPKYHMFSFMNSSSSSASPPVLIFNNVSILNVFYNVNSLVDFNIKGYVNFSNSIFNYFSSCGAILKNTNSPLNNYQPLNAQYTEYITNYNLRRTSDLQNATDLQTYMINITNCVFQSFNYLKIVSTIPLSTNGFSGNVDHGYIIHLQNFNGNISFVNNTVYDIKNAQSACSNNCISNVVSTEQIPLLYGVFDTLVNTYILFISRHEGEVVIGSTFNFVIPSCNIIYLYQYSYPAIFINNTFTGSGTMRNGGIINVIKEVQTSYKTQNQILISNQLTSASDLPCSGLVFNGNTIKQIYSCSNGFSQISFQCVNNGNAYQIPLPNDLLSSIQLGNATKIYSIKILNQIINFDVNEFQMNNNIIDQLIGNTLSPIVLIQSFVKVSHSSNTISNTGRYIQNTGTIWKFILVNKKNFIDSAVSCSGTKTDDTYGFLSISNSLDVVIKNNSLTNMFFTFQTGNQVPDYSSHVSFSKVFGNIQILNNVFQNTTGMLNDYNTNTLKVFTSSLTSSFSTSSINSYQFVPAYTTDGTNKIKTLYLINNTFSNCIGFINDASQGGLFLNIKYNDVMNTFIDRFSSNNTYIYGPGGLIYSNGDITIQNANLLNYGVNAPLKDNTNAQGSPFELIVPNSNQSSNIVNIKNLTVSGINKVQKSVISIQNDTSTVGYQSATTNIYVEAISISNCTSSMALIYINAGNLVCSFNKISLQNNQNIISSAVYIENGGNIIFNNSIFSGNLGQTSYDFYISQCQNCSVSIYNSNFTGSSTTDASSTYLKPSSIYAVNLENLGAAINLELTYLEVYNSRFINNSALFGGAIYTESETVSNLTYSTYQGNFAYNQGGVFYIREGSAIILNNCFIANNSATNEGVITITENSYIIDEGSEICYNTAIVDHSVLSIIEGLPCRFSNTHVHDNIKPSNNAFSVYFLYTDITFSGVKINYENMKIVFSTLSIDQSIFENKFEPILPTITNRGGFLNIFESTCSIYNSCFINGRADYGGAIYVYDTVFNAIGLTFTNNTANTYGGAYYGLISNDFNIEDHTFLDNRAINGEAIYLENINDYTTISNCSFSSSQPSQFINANFASLLISDCTFENNIPSGFDLSSAKLRNGGAIMISTTVMINLTSSIFKNIISNNGAIYLYTSLTEATLSQLYPYLTSDSSNWLVNIFNNTFINDQSYGDKGGGAICYDCALAGCQLNLAENSNYTNEFINCYSNTTGGAILYTYFKPNNIELSLFSNNSALLYASDISSPAQKLLIVSKEFYLANVNSYGDSQNVSIGYPIPGNTIYNQVSGGNVEEFYIGIFNEYNVLVKSQVEYDLIATIAHNPNEPYLATINKASVFISQNGLFNISNMEIIATPNSEQTVVFQTQSFSLPLKVKVRGCISGEEFKNNGECSICQAEIKYLIDPPSKETPCKDCPISIAMCLGGNQIYPRSGYWRSSNTSDNIVKCFESVACEGYTVDNQNVNGGCSLGYTGTMCGSCDIGYSHTGDFKCGKCPNQELGIFFVFLASIIIIIMLALTTCFTINSIKAPQSGTNGSNVSKQSNIGTYIKIFTNHSQFIVIIQSLRINWPSAFSFQFEMSNKMGEPQQQIYSIDCLIDKRTEEDPNANPFSLYFIRVIISFALPIITVICVVCYWLIHYKIKSCFIENKANQNPNISMRERLTSLAYMKKARIIACLIIALMYIQPNIFQINMEMFNCLYVDDSLRLVKDIDTKCFSGDHILYLLTISVPLILICIIFTIIIFMILKRNKRNLFDYKTECKYGFLFKGYKTKYYWWELVIISRKMLLVCILSVLSSFGVSIQCFLIFILFSFYIYIHVKCNPFLRRELNTLETLSMANIIILIYCAVFISSASTNTNVSYKTKNSFQIDNNVMIVLSIFVILTIIAFYIYFIYFLLIKLYYFCKKYCSEPNNRELEIVKENEQIEDNMFDINERINELSKISTEPPKTVIESLRDLNQNYKELVDFKQSSRVLRFTRPQGYESHILRVENEGCKDVLDENANQNESSEIKSDQFDSIQES